MHVRACKRLPKKWEVKLQINDGRLIISNSQFVDCTICVAGDLCSGIKGVEATQEGPENPNQT